MTVSRIILHLDMDAFFASVEVRDDPALAGKPVVVGGTVPFGRGVVATCSYEARSFGIHSAMPLGRAQALCPHAVFLPVRMRAYREASERIIRILGEYTDLVEPASLDEAYLDLTHTAHLFGTPRTIARLIKDRIAREERLPLSIGIAPNKALAKLASTKAKPNGVLEILPGEEIRYLSGLPIRDLHGVGEAIARELEVLGVATVGQLAGLDRAVVENALGAYGAFLHDLSRGIDESPVVASREPKSISREITFARDTKDRAVLSRELAVLIEDVVDELHEEGAVARTVTVKIRFSDFKTITRSCTTPDPLYASAEIIRIAEKLFAQNAQNRKVRLIGVGLSHLIKGPCEVQQSFLQDYRGKQLADSVHAIRKKFGKESISTGKTVPRGKS